MSDPRDSSAPIRAAVDGSSLGNPGPAGWAWVVDSEHWDAGGWPSGTNNLGELTAVLELLRATDTDEMRGRRLEILADSQYAINVVTKWAPSWKKKGWRKADNKPIANLEVIQQIDHLIASRDAHFTWVRGHAGHALNELADTHARGAAEAYRSGRTPTRGPGFSSHSDEGVLTADNSDATHSHGNTTDDVHVNASAVIRRKQKQLIRAWACLDNEELLKLEASDGRVIDHDGRAFSSLRDVSPQPDDSCRVSRIDVIPAGSNTWIASFTIAGESANWPAPVRAVSVWSGVLPERARTIWQQFTAVTDTH